jgi:hypothetical protein
MNIAFQNQSRSNQVLLLNALFLAILVLIGKADPMAIVFAYVFETIVIGFFHVLKLNAIMKHNPEKKEVSKTSKIFMITFFSIHFTFFILIQTLFIYIAFAIQDDGLSTSLSSKILTNFFELSGFKIVMTTIFITHLIDYAADFLQYKKYRNQDVELYFIKPYIRIFIQHFLAIIPFFFLLFDAKVGVVATLLLIVLRTLLDFYLNWIEKNKKQSEAISSRLFDDRPTENREMKQPLNRFL